MDGRKEDDVTYTCEHHLITNFVHTATVSILANGADMLSLSSHVC